MYYEVRVACKLCKVTRVQAGMGNRSYQRHSRVSSWRCSCNLTCKVYCCEQVDNIWHDPHPVIDLVLAWLTSIDLVLAWLTSIDLVLTWLTSIDLVLVWLISIDLVLAWFISIDLVLTWLISIEYWSSDGVIYQCGCCVIDHYWSGVFDRHQVN